MTYNTKKKKIRRVLNKTYLMLAVIAISALPIGFHTMKLYKDIENIVSPAEVRAEVKEVEIDNLPIQEWLWNELDNYNFTMQEKINTILLIGSCENKGWDPEARYINKNAKSVDRGLFMINDVYHKEVSNSCSYDKDCAIKEFVRIYRERSWAEWTCGRTLGLK